MGTCRLYKTYISHKRLSQTPPRTTTTPSRRSSSLKGGVLSQDTSVTPYIHATHFPPVSTTICHKFHCNLPQSTVSAKFCHNLLFLPNSAKSAKFYPNQDNVQYSTVNLATKLTIYTPSSLFFTFFPYTTS